MGIINLFWSKKFYRYNNSHPHIHAE
jgi:hypothetical protein